AGLGGGAVGNEVDTDLVDVRLLDAGVAVARLATRRIVVEADELDVLAALPFAELERAGADRCDPFAVGPERAAGNDRGRAAVRPGDRAEERGGRLVELDGHSFGVGRFDRFDLRKALAVQLRQAAPLRRG